MSNNRYQTLMPFIICGLAALFYVYDYFVQVAPSVITNQLMHDLAINAAGLSILGSSFYYSYSIMQIPAGMLLDRLGARISLTCAVAISACGVILFGLAHSLFAAGVARFLIGFGSAFSFISTLFLAARWFSHKYFAFIAGLTQFGASLGSIFGLAPIAILTAKYSWHEVMIITGIITLIASVLFWLIIHDGKKKLTDADNKVVPFFSLLKQIDHKWQILWISLSGFLSWVPVATIGALWGTPYLVQTYSISTTNAGKLCSLFWFGLAIGSPFIGWYSDRIKRRCRPVIFAFFIGVVASILLIEAINLPIWLTAIALFLLGASASVQSLTFGLIKDNVADNVFATVSGINNMAAIIGGAIAQMSVGVVLSFTWHGQIINHVPVYTVNDYRIAFIILPFAALFGLIVTKKFIKETLCQSDAAILGRS